MIARFQRGMVIVLCTVCLIPHLAGAQEISGSEGALTLTLERAVELALEKSLDLEQGFIDVSLAGESAKNLWARVFPEISLGGGVGYRTPLFTDPHFQTDKANVTYNASLGITLQLNASLKSSMDILKLAYQTRLLSYDTLRRQLEFQVARTFYGLLAARENLSNLEELLGLSERQYARDQVAFANGLVSQRIVLQSRLGAETAKLNRAQGILAYNQAVDEFLALLGLESGTQAILEGSIEVKAANVDPEELISRYLPQRPDIIAQRQTIEQLELTRNNRIKSARSPSLSIGAQWGGSGTGAGDDFSDSLSGSLTLRIPIESWIPGSVPRQEINQAEGDVEKARLELRKIEDAARREIRSLTENLNASWGALEIARLRSEIAEQGYALTEQGFQNGTVESLALEDARNSMAEARQQVLEGELDYKIMLLDLAAALNGEENFWE